jgi:hypothetical protein
MSTSNRTTVFEAAGLALLTAGALVLGTPQDVWLRGLGFHPAWIAIIVLAAHYGCVGLFLGLGFVVASISGASVLMGGNIDGLYMRAQNPSDLIALATAILVAWMAMRHESKNAHLTRRLEVAEREQSEAAEALSAFHDHVAPLKARYDRIDLSLTMWRDLAARLESGDAATAARAGLELASIRSGAQGGVVHCWEGTTLSVLARYGRENPAETWARDIFSVDRTAKLAVEQRRPVLATQVDGATEEDSDVAAPILDAHGLVLGVIALRGLSPSRLRAIDIHDLNIVAQWLAPALARSISAPRLLSTVEAAT